MFKIMNLFEKQFPQTCFAGLVLIILSAYMFSTYQYGSMYVEYTNAYDQNTNDVTVKLAESDDTHKLQSIDSKVYQTQIDSSDEVDTKHEAHHKHQITIEGSGYHLTLPNEVGDALVFFSNSLQNASDDNSVSSTDD